MALGQRIKQARLEAGLSQRQLCGDTITRNMLSLIESGRAKPGMDTLTILAARLNRPVSWFLEEAVVVSADQAALGKARQAYAAGDYRQAVRELEDRDLEQEGLLLLLLSLTAGAQRALEENKPVYAHQLLEKAEDTAQNCMYDTPALQYQRKFLLAKAAPKSAWTQREELETLTDRLLLLRAEHLPPEDAARVLDAVMHREEGWYFARGQAALARKEYAQAAELLHRAESTMPRQCAPLLEQCYRELEDYKKAYEYACKQKGN